MHACRSTLEDPTALSRQISSLEQLVGCELFRRSTHRVELTLAGEALLQRARNVLSEIDQAVTEVQSVGGELLARALKLFEPISALPPHEANLGEVRAAFESLHAQFEPPGEVDVRPVTAGGVPSLSLAAEARSGASLLFLHGGGYILGSAFGYRPLAGAIAVASQGTVLVPDFRLAPEHPFPAALEDALSAYRWLIERDGGARAVTLVGDSSGGGLAMSLLVALKERELPLPGGAVLLCPHVNLALGRGDASSAPPWGPVLEWARRCADAYLAGHPADDPLVNPLEADLTGMPPLLIQAATSDIVFDDAQGLTAHARRHGVDVHLELYPTDAHSFQMFWPFLPEAINAVEQAGAFAQTVANAAENDLDTGGAGQASA